jgi:hypothetical protein
MTRSTVVVATALALLSPSAAQAQQYMLGGQAAVSSGFEAGDPGTGSTTFRRARTRLSAGLDARVDETPKDGMGIVIYTDLEPHISVGGELRYMHWFSPTAIGYAGGTSAFAPHTLLGGTFGLQLRFPLDLQGTAVIVEPSFSALPLGTDLPSDKMLIWGLLSLGIHTNL